MNPQEVQHIETTVEELKEKVAMAEALDVLHRSTAFKKVILKGFFEEKAIGLAAMYGQASINETQKKIVENALLSISGLKGHFLAIYKEGEAAKEALEEYEALEAEARSNG